MDARDGGSRLRVGGWVPQTREVSEVDATGPAPLWPEPESDEPRPPRRFWIDPWYGGRRRATAPVSTFAVVVVSAVALVMSVVALRQPLAGSNGLPVA